MNRLSIIRFVVFLVVSAGLIISLFLFRSNEFLFILITVSLLLVVLSGAIYYMLGIIHPLYLLEQKMRSLAKGEILDDETRFKSSDTSGLRNAITEHNRRQKEIAKTINDLSAGKVQDDFIASGENDQVGKAILKLRQSIIHSTEETQKRRVDDEQQNWVSRGLANFGDLFRELASDPKEFSGKIIGELVTYLEIEVGGLFLLQQDEGKKPEYVLYGAYAFDREKYQEKTFSPGEGLVGRCALEKNTIYITDVPEDYIRIRSGIGEDRPSSILLVPVILDEQVLGVIELASFDVIPAYKISFVESLALSLASTLAKTRLFS